MKIIAVETHLIDRPADRAYRWRRGLPASEPARTEAWLRIVTDDGVDGVAWSRRGVIAQDIVDRRLRRELIGQDPLRREWIWERMWDIDRIEEVPIYLFGLVDNALWDLAAKAAGLPLYRLLGNYRDAIPAYASTVTYASIEEYLDVADQCLELGYPALKLHAWGDWREDARLCSALREHVGPDMDLMYDGSAAFDLSDAIRLGRVLEEADYLWYEEPMREFSITAYRWLGERVRVPLLLAETSDGAHMNTADFIASGAATFVRTDAILRGGVTGAMRIAHLADSYRLRAEVHSGGLVHAHLALAIPNTTYYESLVLTNPVEREPLVGPDGLATVPDGVLGVGWESAEALPWM